MAHTEMNLTTPKTLSIDNAFQYMIIKFEANYVRHMVIANKSR